MALGLTDLPVELFLHIVVHAARACQSPGQFRYLEDALARTCRAFARLLSRHNPDYGHRICAFLCERFPEIGVPRCWSRRVYLKHIRHVDIQRYWSPPFRWIRRAKNLRHFRFGGDLLPEYGVEALQQLTRVSSLESLIICLPELFDFSEGRRLVRDVIGPQHHLRHLCFLGRPTRRVPRDGRPYNDPRLILDIADTHARAHGKLRTIYIVLSVVNAETMNMITNKVAQLPACVKSVCVCLPSVRHLEADVGITPRLKWTTAEAIPLRFLPPGPNGYPLTPEM